MHKPYDREQVTKIISDIERYTKDLQELGISGREELEDRRTLYALSMLLFTIINRALDLADEVIITNRLGMPQSYREIFDILRRRRFIDRELAEEMAALVFYRNMIAHQYDDLTDDDLYSLFQRLGTITKFVDRMKEIIREGPQARGRKR
ncbi:MAG: type VII toxin-antitoxin system HepT family RNase toxin [Methanomicrobiales archaeon]